MVPSRRPRPMMGIEGKAAGLAWPTALLCERCPQGGAMEKTHDALAKLALFCANQARTNAMKDAAREAYPSVFMCPTTDKK
jgi:hypothetical protein